jgi:hypothetical protein
MRNLFDTDVYNEIKDRINKLHPASPANWGKMTVSQMLAHCRQPVKVALSEKKLPRMFIGRILGSFIKSKLYNDSSWKQNLPTSPTFIIRDERDFETEKNKLLEITTQFYTAGPTGITKHPHPFFGSFTPEQWGKSMFKHLDHHLKQFGV